MKPLVTIVAISYNQERFVKDALDSIKAQTYGNIQLIIADDGSVDSTKSIIGNWIVKHWPGVIFLNHPQNLGLTKNLNSAIPHVHGKYYQFIGCEDIMLPNKISQQVAILEQMPDVDIVYSDMHRMREDGTIESESHFQKNSYNIPENGFVYTNLIKKCFISTPTVLMRTTVLKQLNGYNENLAIDDYDFWIRAALKFKFYYHDDVTMQYRIMENSLSNRKGIHRFKTRFLVYYYNYDKRKLYRSTFDERLKFSLKNLFYNGYHHTSLYALKAFIKTSNLFFAGMFFRSLPLLMKRNND